MPPRPPLSLSTTLLGLSLIVASSCSEKRDGPSRAPAPAQAAMPAPAPAKPAPAAAAPKAAAPGLSLEERRKIGGRIAFIAERDGNREIYLMGPDGTGERRLTSSPAADYTAPASPDGKALLVITVEGEEGPHTLWLHPLDGGKAKRLTPPSGRMRNPNWSPDGRSVIFESNLHSHFSDIYRVARDGSGLRQLTNNPEGNYEPMVAPRGDAIVHVSSRDRVAELYLMKSDGSASQRLTNTPRDEWGPRWSPDGALIAFVSDRESADRVYVMPAGGGEARRVSRRELDARVVEDAPAWAPGGRVLAYVLKEPGAPGRIVIVDVDSGREREIVLPGGSGGGGTLGEPAWSPDGRHLAFTCTRDRDTQIYLARADGSGAIALTHPPGANWHPVWVPPARR